MNCTSEDLIAFLLGLDFLQTRHHLLCLFRLCCLSATSSSSTYRDITEGSITTAGHQSRFTDVILPCQSYMASVSGSVTLCSDDSYLEKFSLLSASFARTAFSPTYDSRTFVENFGRSKVYKSLLSSYRAVLAGPKKVSVRSEAEDFVIEESALKPPSDNKRKRMETCFPIFFLLPSRGIRTWHF